MAKVRVYELAKELGLESKQLLQILNGMGEFVRSASSTIKAPAVRRIKQEVLDGPRTGQQPTSYGARRPGAATRPRGSYDDRVIKLPAKPPESARSASQHQDAASPASARTGKAAATNNTPEALAIAVDLVLKLHPVEIDAVELGQADHPEFRLRVDKLDDEKNPYWISVWISEQALPIPGAWKRLQKWRLPLKPLDTPEHHLPGLGILQLDDEKAVGRSAEMIAAQMLGHDATSVKLSVEECSSSEASRRYDITVLVHRRRGNGGRKRFAETTCLKCGLPLSDPTSVKVGIGPECRRQMGQDAIRALSVPAGSSRRVILGAQKSTTWIGVVQRRFAGFR